MSAKRESEKSIIAQMILTVVLAIPFGRVASYGQVAKMAGLPRHARLVGRLLSQLDQHTTVPWHRVINAQGQISLCKETEQGENIQQKKLLEEGVVVLNGRVNMKKFTWNNDEGF